MSEAIPTVNSRQLIVTEQLRMDSTGLFLVGTLIGVAVATIGALVDYWLSFRPSRRTARALRLPGCFVYVLGGLGLAGVLSGLVSLMSTGGIAAAMLMGLGVITGFYCTFLGLSAFWLLLQEIWLGKRSVDSVQDSQSDLNPEERDGSI